MVRELLGTGTPHQGVVGNGSMTACINQDGNATSIFWPRMGYADQLEEASAGVFVPSPAGGEFLWLDRNRWEVSQRYRAHSNVIETWYHGSGFGISRTDFVDPQSDVFVSAFRVTSGRSDPGDVHLLLYQNPDLDETRWGNATFYDATHDLIIQYRRRTYFAFGAVERSSSHQCGIENSKSDARIDCEDGRLENSDTALYRGKRGVNSALAFHLGPVSAGVPRELCYFAAAGGDRERAIALLERARSIGGRQLVARSVNHWKSLVRGRKGKGRKRDSRINAMVERSILTLLMLCDKKTGGIIASPSTDPDYRYVWPRDASYVALALDRSGYHAHAERFYQWCMAAQDRTGVLHQRYYSIPNLIGPAWGPAWGEEIDETATILWGMAEHLRITKDRGFLSEIWPFVRDAAWYLVTAVDHSGRVRATMDLWEEKPARHIYSAATVAAGLKAASSVAGQLSYAAEARRWARVADLAKEHLLSAFWDDRLGHFVKSTEPRDGQVDISSLAISFPFGLLPDRNPKMVKNARALHTAFSYKVGGVGRFPKDVNYGGNPWVLSACWMAIHYAAAGDSASSRALVEWCADHATHLGLLSEQVDKDAGTVLSAVPLAWSHAMFILASRALLRGP